MFLENEMLLFFTPPKRQGLITWVTTKLVEGKAIQWLLLSRLGTSQTLFQLPLLMNEYFWCKALPKALYNRKHIFVKKFKLSNKAII